jgi:hypothetical protein
MPDTSGKSQVVTRTSEQLAIGSRVVTTPSLVHRIDLVVKDTKNHTNKQTELRFGSRGTCLARWGSELNPQYCQKKNVNKQISSQMKRYMG